MADVAHIYPDTPVRRKIVRNTIENTIKPGQEIVIPFEQYVWDGKKGHEYKRSQRVRAVEVVDGYVDVFNTLGKGKGYVVLPEVMWRGDGGRTMMTKVTPEFCGVNRIVVPYIPRLELRHRKLDYRPTFGPGWDNRDVA
jgi:hypothetical protein